MARLLRGGEVTVEVAAPPHRIWPLLVDIARLGEWSHEAHDGEWLDGDGPRVGARFRARNRSGRARWTRTSEVTSVVPDTEFAWRTVPTLRYPDSTEWRIRLEPIADGTRIVQSFEVVMLPFLLDLLYSVTVPAHVDRRDALAGDLRRLGAASFLIPLPSFAATTRSSA